MRFHFKHRHGGFGQHGPGMHRGHRRHGGSRQRGDLKFEILGALLDGPRHGYDIMLAIEATRGLRPSPGSIYPALQMLEDSDAIRGEERDGKRVYTITDAGREQLAQRDPAEADEARGDADMFATVAEAMRQVHGIRDAVKQIARTGNLELYTKGIAVLDRARRDLFAILADHV